MILLFEENEILSYKEICERVNEKTLTKRDKQYERWDNFLKREPIGRKWKINQFDEYTPPPEFKETKYSCLKQLILSKGTIEMTRTRFYKQYMGVDITKTLDISTEANKEDFWRYEDYVTGKVSNIFNSAIKSLESKGLIYFDPTVLKVRENGKNRDCTKTEWAYYCSQLEYYKRLSKPATVYYDLARKKTKQEFGLENAWREMIIVAKQQANVDGTEVKRLHDEIKKETELVFANLLESNVKLKQYHNSIFIISYS